MKEIELTKGQAALVDDTDFTWLNQWKWNAHWEKTTNSYYARRTIRVLIDGRKYDKTLQMSRVIMKTPDELMCDHINHNTLDNRRENLRNVTNSINQLNSRKRKYSTRKTNVWVERSELWKNKSGH